MIRISRFEAHESALPATLIAPEFCKISSLRKQRAQGMPGAQPHPQPRVRMKKAHEQSHHRYAETFRHSLRDGFTVSFALSPETGLSCLRHWRDVKTSSPTWHQRRDARTTRLRRPLSVAFVFSREKRPPHPVPNVRDDRETPLIMGAGWRGLCR
jgi:hypothetical protein